MGTYSVLKTADLTSISQQVQLSQPCQNPRQSEIGQAEQNSQKNLPVFKSYSHPLQPIGRIPEPVQSHVARLSFFSEKDTPKTALEKIDNIWRSKRLFWYSNEPNSEVYTEYLISLTELVDRNHAYFIELCKPLNGKEETLFEKTFYEFLNRPGIPELQKAICLTQAVEMAFMGIDQTRVLKNIISNARIPKECRIGNEWREVENGNGNKSDRLYEGGFFQEALAGWFLAKFIYQTTPSVSNVESFIHSSIHSSVKRKNKIRKSDKKNRVEGEKVNKEIDIRTEDSLISVRSMKNDYSEQISNLFFVIKDDDKYNLAARMKKLILVRCAEKPYQFSPDFMTSRDYKEAVKLPIIEGGRDFIRKYESLDTEGEKLLERLVSSQGIDLYFIPPVNNLEHLKLWIQLCIEYKDEFNKQALIA